MIYLIAAIACSTGNSLIIKFAERKTGNRLSLLLVNYIAAVLFGLIFIAADAGGGGAVPAATDGRTVLMGLVNGVLYIASFILLQKNILVNGATVSASLSHMGLLIPVLLSIVVFSEIPTGVQIAGTAFALAAIVLISVPQKSRADTSSIPQKNRADTSSVPQKSNTNVSLTSQNNHADVSPTLQKSLADTSPVSQKGHADASSTPQSIHADVSPTSQNSLSDALPVRGGNRLLLIPMLLSSGTADMMSKLFEAYCDHAAEAVFMQITFTTSMILCLAGCMWRHEKINRYDIIYGIFLGIFNYMSVKLLIWALYGYQAFMIYILYGIGVILLMNAINVLLMHETLSRRDYAGMGLIIGAIILLNL